MQGKGDPVLQAQQDRPSEPPQAHTDAQAGGSHQKGFEKGEELGWSRSRTYFYVKWTLKTPSAALIQNQGVSRSSLGFKLSHVLSS